MPFSFFFARVIETSHRIPSSSKSFDCNGIFRKDRKKDSGFHSHSAADHAATFPHWHARCCADPHAEATGRDCGAVHWSFAGASEPFDLGRYT
jgi:hypothetical protein